MANNKKGNSYAKKSKEQSLLKKLTYVSDTKGNVKNTLVETGKDVLVGVVGGGLLGAAIGRPSLVIGAGVTGAGHYMGNRMATLLGIGMMAANGFQKSKTVEGLEGMDMQSIKDRMLAYKDNFAEKLYIDRIMKKKGGGSSSSKEETSGFGDLQFFNYPNDMNGTSNDLSALDSIEKQIAESGMAHMQMRGFNMDEVGEISGDMGDLNDMEGLEDIGDLGLAATDLNL